MAKTRRCAGLRLGVATLLVILVAGLVDSPIFTFYRISGNSMLPSFENGDRVLVTKLPVALGMLDVGDAVIARHDGEVLIKRVMGTPGDRVEVRAGVVYIDGEPVEAPAPPEERDYWSFDPVELGPDEYFLLGDNRRVSVDSRTFGPVHDEEIIGIVMMRFRGREDDPSRVSAASER